MRMDLTIDQFDAGMSDCLLVFEGADTSSKETLVATNIYLFLETLVNGVLTGLPISEDWKGTSYDSILGIKRQLSTVFYPQTNGQSLTSSLCHF